MHKCSVDEKEQLISIKFCVVFQLKKKSGNLEGCFFKSCLVCQGKKKKKRKRESAFCMWFMSKNTHAAHHTDLKRLKCCSKTPPERESMGTKPQWTKSPWIISSSELICQANINTISVDPWVSSFSSYTWIFWRTETCHCLQHIWAGRKKKKENNLMNQGTISFLSM